MSPIAHIRKSIWSCCCITCHIANLLLALLALGLAGLIVLNLFQKSVPLPEKLASWVINKSTPGYLQATWSKVVFDLRAGLYLSGFELKNTRTEQIILTAEDAYIKWSPIDFLIPGTSFIDEIEAGNIEIYVPVSHSPSGLNEPVVFIDHIFSRERSGTLIVDSLLLKTGGFRLHLTGQAPIHQLLESIAADSPQPDTRSPASLYPGLQKLGRLPKDLKADLTAHWELLHSGSHVLRLSGLLPEFVHKQVGLEKISGNAVLLFTGNHLSVRELDLEGVLLYMDDLPDIPFLDLPENPLPIPFHLSANGPPVQIGQQQVPSRLRLSLHPDDAEIKFQHLILHTVLSPDLDNPVNWILTGPSAFAAGWASPGHPAGQDPLPLSFPRRFSFRTYLPDSSIYQFLDAPLPHRLLVGTRADSIRLNGSFDLDLRQLSGSTVVDGLNIGQTQFNHLFSNLVLNPELISLDNVHISKSSLEHATGSYSQHFPSSRFSLNAAGVIFPSSLDAILGKWWTGIFSNIHASQPLPGDVTVWGHWGDESSLRSVTEVHGPGVSYRGVEIPRMELRVRSNDEWAYLDELRAEFERGEIEGSIAIQSGVEETDSHRAYRLDLMSTAPWEVVLGASGLESLDILAFRGGEPQVGVSGILWQDSGKGHAAREAAELSIRLTQREGICQLKTLEISGLALNGKVSGNRLDLTGLSGQFAEGIFSGSLSITDWQDGERMRQQVDLDLINADYRVARHQLSGFVGMGTVEADPTVEDLGRLDAQLRLAFGQELESYTGRGNISIHQGKLGKVHIFGELSRLLATMGLGFTTVEMTTLTLDWFLAGPALEIRNGRVTGPALNLTLGGWVDLETQGLRMKSELTLFSGLFSKMLTPVSDTLQFDLVGTIEDPDWEVRFNPFRWALNRMESLSAPSPDQP